MRQKIQDIIHGKFEYDHPTLLLEEEVLDLPVIENEVYHGSFHVKSSTGTPIRGIVTCEHPSIRIPSPEFDSDYAEIRFDFTGKPVSDDLEENGVFVVTTSAGEYIYPFTVQTSRHYLATSIGKIKTLNDFYNLCKLNWDEALDVFSSRYFCNIFHENSDYYRLLYSSVTQQKCSSHELEEFLIATGKKKRCEFSVAGDKRSYCLTDRTISDTIIVHKSEWGYCDIRISCPESFVELGKDQLKMYDFFGKHTDFSFRLRPDRMHAGRNFARITMENGFQKETVELECILGEIPGEHSLDWTRRYYRYQLESSYLSYLLHEKSDTEWILESIDMIQHALEEDPKDRWMNLFLAYLYLEAKDYSRMEEQMKRIPNNMRYAKSPLAVMYQYLEYLRNGGDASELLAKVNEVMIRYRRHPILNWIRFQIDDSLTRNPQRKYDAIRQFMKNDSTSPILYLQAAQILQSYPEFVNSRDDFDCSLLGWMSGKNLLTRDLALRIQGMAQGRQSFNRNYLRVLSKCFKKFGDQGFVKTICVYLIHTNRYGEIYFPWFRRGVEQHLKIAGLYEAYILSWSRSLGELPPEVVRYFSMSSTLPARKKATLYAYIVRNKNRLERDWPDYISVVREFAVSELQKNHMNDDLAIIYEEIRRMMTREEWEAVKGGAESCYKVHVGKTNFQAVRVMQNLSSEMDVQRKAISGESAYIYLYSSPYFLLYEGKDGLLYVPGKECRVSKMLPGNRLPSRPEEMEPDNRSQIREEPVVDVMERFNNLAGPIDEMTELVLAMQEQGVDVLPQAQQLMMRMLFTGHLSEDHRDIFRILKKDRDSEELLIAYVSVLCRELMLHDTQLDASSYQFLYERLAMKKDNNPFFKAAFLRMFAEHPEEAYEDLAEKMFREYVFAGVYLPCFNDFPDKIRIRYLMMGIRVISYSGEPGDSFYIQYSNGTKESFDEVLPGLYTHQLKIFPGEKCEYTVVDSMGRIRAKESIQITEIPEAYRDTRYGRLGSLGISDLNAQEQYSYAETCDLVNTLFIPTEE